jgi:hypothetical protein
MQVSRRPNKLSRGSLAKASNQAANLSSPAKANRNAPGPAVAEPAATPSSPDQN